ncbi:glycosyltransferase [Diplogelasinospora grovesii]|uniref:Glycosyltransferase n=1 Tax=Diplogelasinospora grovesii TaxID=303347 RepID=A0AAN6N920_9PEZI|nr:glycosyltransferase [Diplogelasinospora grovesii]
MRVFLIQTAKGLSASSGGYKANISLLRALRSHGHAAAQICYGFENEVEYHAKKAEAKGVRPNVTPSIMTVTLPNGADRDIDISTFTDQDEIHNIGVAVTDRIRSMVNLFRTHIARLDPTHIIFNDPLTMKATSFLPRSPDVRRVAVIHSADELLPFGPLKRGLYGQGFCEAESALLRGVDGIWSVSQAIVEYAWKYGRLETTFFVHHPLTYMHPTTRRLPVRRFNVDKDEVGMINPCPPKGLSILLGLAQRLPNVKFVTWKSWGTGSSNIERIRQLPNIQIEETTRDTEEIWSRIKVLIVPSLWYEAWGIVITEAQLRGIPVIASDSGGLPEAKIGLPYCIPVKPITGERSEDGDYVIPEQDIEPWAIALEKLMTSRADYNGLSELTARKARKWLQGLDEDAIEKWLLQMTRPR